LKNPSAQDSRTVKNLAAATHWRTPELKSSAQSPALGSPKSCNGGPRKDSGKLSFLEKCCSGVVQAQRSLDQKMIQLLARPQLSRQPAWLLAAARPSLFGIIRIAIFGKNLWIWMALVLAERWAELAQTLVQFRFLNTYSASQFVGNLLV